MEVEGNAASKQHVRNGKDGLQGNAGTNGKSVTLASESAGTNCEKGGTKVEVEGNAASKQYVCNGKEGTFGGQTLPSGKTLTGMFAATGYSEVKFPESGLGTAVTGVSFALPLAKELAAHVIKVNGVSTTECPGTVQAPAAEKSNLCVYLSETENAFEGTVNVSPTKFGFTAGAVAAVKGSIQVEGTWAVTAE